MRIQNISANLDAQPVRTICCEAIMWRTILVSASLAALMMQCTISVPTPPTEDHKPASNEIRHGNIESTTQDDVTIIGRKQLTLLAFKNYTTLYNFQLLRTLQIAKDVLADPEVSGMDTEEMREERRVLEDYIKRMKDTAEVRQFPGRTDDVSLDFFTLRESLIIDHFESYLRSLNTSQTFYRTSESHKLLWQAMLRHGLAEYRTEVDQRFELFATNFANDVLRYVGSLNPTEQKKEKALVKYCQEYEQHIVNVSQMELGIILSQAFMPLEWQNSKMMWNV